jgi:hypothetical protein
MNSKDGGLLIASLFLILATFLQTFQGSIPSIPGMAGALFLSLLTAVSFYAKAVQHQGEQFDAKKLFTTLLTALALGGLIGNAVTEVQLQIALGGALGTNMTIIVETLAKALTKSR